MMGYRQIGQCIMTELIAILHAGRSDNLGLPSTPREAHACLRVWGANVLANEAPSIDPSKFPGRTHPYAGKPRPKSGPFSLIATQERNDQKTTVRRR